MKIKLSIALFLGVLTQVFSQDGLTRHLKGVDGCYLGYYSEFLSKGAEMVPDGVQEVVVSVIYQNSSECYMGKTTVKDGKLTMPVFLQTESQTYSPLSAIFDDMDMNWLATQDIQTLYDIDGGMSKLFVSQQGYQIQMFFPEYVNPVAGVYQKAPPAKELFHSSY